MGFWAAAIPAGITLGSALLGLGGGNKNAGLQDDAIRQGINMGQERLGLARWQLDDFKTNILPMRDKMIAEATGDGHTAGYGKAVGAFQRGMGKVQDDILSRDTPTGMAIAGLNGLGIEKAKGMATLELDDNAKKEADKKALLQLGYQTPGAVSNFDRTAGDNQNFFTQLAKGYGDGASAGYGAAGQALSSLAGMFADGKMKSLWNQ